jgi:hypothetical protein
VAQDTDVTRFADPQIVRCPSCGALATRLGFASVNLSGGLFPSVFQAIAKGEVVCPRCNADIDANKLVPLVTLDAAWKRGVWAGIPKLWPRDR